MVRISQRPAVVTVIKPSRPLVSWLIAQAEKLLLAFRRQQLDALAAFL